MPLLPYAIVSASSAIAVVITLVIAFRIDAAL